MWQKLLFNILTLGVSYGWEKFRDWKRKKREKKLQEHKTLNEEIENELKKDV